MRGADLKRIAYEVDPFVFKGDKALLRMNATFISAEEIPTKHKIKDEVPHNAAVGPHKATIDSEGDVDDAQSLHSATIDANSFAFEGFDLVGVEGWVFTNEFLTYAGSLTASVTECLAQNIIYFDVNFCLIKWF